MKLRTAPVIATPTPIASSRTASARVYGLPDSLARAIAVFPPASALILGVMLAVPASHARAAGMLKEDRLVENLTVVAYVAAAVLAAAWAWRSIRRRAPGRQSLGAALLGLLCFGLGMEEISWGERWLHFRIPGLLARFNVQHEPTIHNLEPFQDLSRWFPLGLALLALAAILLHTRPRRDETGVPGPLIAFCWTIIPLAAYDNLTDWVPINLTFDTIVGMLSELVEMLVAFGFALGIWLAMRREARQRAGGADPVTGRAGRRLKPATRGFLPP